MPFIDLHCDTLYKIHRNPDTPLKNNTLSVDIQKLKNAHSKAQFFAIFFDQHEYETEGCPLGTPMKYFNRLCDIFSNEMSQNRNIISPATSWMDYVQNIYENKISAFLTIEGAEVLEGNHENLIKAYTLGARLVTLTWNFENAIGYPNSANPAIMNLGLKNFGFETIELMNHLRMIIDVSHLSDGGFYDVANHSIKPFLASHSNARAITPNPRNLTDNMIRIISEKGGIIGINFYSPFLIPGGFRPSGENILPVTAIRDIVIHIRHMMNIGGVDCISLGTDFDGIDCDCEIKNIGEIQKLADALENEGFTLKQIEKICYQNAERFLQDSL